MRYGRGGMSKSRTVLTENHFFKYTTCPHWIWFDHFGDQAKRRTTAPLGQLFREQFPEDRRAVARRALKRKKIREITVNTQEDGSVQTRARMREGAEIIVDGIVMHAHRLGHPDLLFRQRGVSVFGRYQYIPVAVGRGPHTALLQKILLAFWATLLEEMQGVLPETGIVVTKNGTRETVVIREFLPRFKKLADEITLILAGQKPAPFLSGGCRESPWFSECVRLAEESRDVTLVAGLNRRMVESLRTHGIKTIDDAAAINVETLQGRAPGYTESSLARIKNQARSLLTRTVIVHAVPRLPKTRTEIFLDFEGNPLRDMEYLIGVLITDDRGIRYQSFFAATLLQEEQMWRSFLAWVKKLPANTRVYHYGSYERQKLGETLPTRYGGSRALTTFLKHAIDIREVLARCAVLPVYFYTLKDVGKYLGFHWSDRDAGGAQSVVWYEAWLENGDQETREKILEYNRNDVEATRVILEWLRGLRK